MAKEKAINLQDEILDLKSQRDILEDNWNSLQDVRENKILAEANLSKFKDMKQIDSEEKQIENDIILSIQSDMAKDKKYLDHLSKADTSSNKEREIMTNSLAKDKKLLEEKKEALQNPLAFSERKLKTYKQQIEQCEAKIKETHGQKLTKDDEEIIASLRNTIKKLEFKTKKHEMLLHYHQKIQHMSADLQDAKSDLKSLDERYKQSPFDNMPESQRYTLKNIEMKCLTEKVAALTQTLNCYMDPDKTTIKKNAEKGSETLNNTLMKEVKKELKALDTSIKHKEKTVSTHMAQEEKRISVDDAVLQNASKHFTTHFNTHRATHNHQVKAHPHIPENPQHPHEKHKGHHP